MKMKTNKHIINRRQFIKLMENPHFDEHSRTYFLLTEMFEDDDLWISEWLCCCRRHTYLEYAVESDGIGFSHVIMDADGFYDLLLRIMKDKKTGKEKYRSV